METKATQIENAAKNQMAQAIQLEMEIVNQDDEVGAVVWYGQLDRPCNAGGQTHQYWLSVNDDQHEVDICLGADFIQAAFAAKKHATDGLRNLLIPF